MPRFVIFFVKDVLGGNGRSSEVCQSMLEVDAANESEAAELAKRKFCEAEQVCEWSLRADRVKVKAADFPS